MLILLCMVVALGMACRFVVAIQKKKVLNVIWFGAEMVAFATIIRYFCN